MTGRWLRDLGAVGVGALLIFGPHGVAQAIGGAFLVWGAIGAVCLAFA